MAFGKPQYTNHNQIKSAVNSVLFANQAPKRIQNRVYRACALDGFNERIRKELAGEQTQNIRLYSHHATRQNYFELGWNSVTARHIEFARLKQQAQDTESLILGKTKGH